MIGQVAVAVLLFFTVVAMSPRAASAEDVAILRSPRVAPYQEATEGARRKLAGTSILEIETPERTDVAVLKRQLKGAGVRVVLAVGRAATEFALRVEDGPPVVYCMVLDPNDIASRSTNLAGVHLLLPVADQIKALHGLIPSIHRLGVLYDPVRSGDIVEQLREAAAASGLEVVAESAGSIREILPALRSLKAKGVQALFMIPDPALYNRDSIESILKFTLENRIAFMATDKDIVRNGALCALSPRFAAVGEQAAGLVASVLQGASVADLPVEPPRDYGLYVNLKTATHIGLTPDPEALRTAAEIWR